MRRVCALILLLAVVGIADDNRSLGDRTRQYLTDLVRLDTSNPPGNETRVAEYLKRVADSYNITSELLGPDPQRKNFIARLQGNGKGRPLLLMAHSDVFPAGDAKQWTVDPFSGELRNGFIYGRGTLDAKSLLAAEMSVMVEIKRRNLNLSRDLILVAQADEETGSTGIQWLIQNAWPKIDAEFALSQGGTIQETKDGTKVFQIQTLEKIPTPMTLTARGTGSRGKFPRSGLDNPVLHLEQAVVHLTDADQPIHINATTRRYLQALSNLADYSWLKPLLPGLENPATAKAAAAQVRQHDTNLDAMLHTTVDPSSPRGNRNGDTARQPLDVRRMPSETREEVLARFRQIVNDSTIELTFASGQPVPATEPSALTTSLYHSLENAIGHVYPRDAVVAPFMSRGATDSSYLRSRGMAVYGAPVFLREPGESRVNANDERIGTKALDDGVELLWQMVLDTAGAN
jgi:acetylornithine deacetylase/succinyl-diaminopimelate desuccinylase-like protein